MEYQLDPGIIHTDLFLDLLAKTPQYMFLYFDIPCELPELTTNLSQLLLLYTISECQMTRVVRERDLGGLVERLREQMEGLPAEQLKEEEELPKIKYSDLELVERVGSGGFGEVFKGRWKSKDKTVAIKKFKFGEMEREVSQSVWCS